MKDKLLNFWNKSYKLIMLSLVYPLVMFTNIGFLGNIVVGSSDLGPTNIYAVYLIFIVPISHFVYGCITCKTAKKALAANIIPAVVYFICFSIFCITDYNFAQVMFFTLLPIAFSLSGTGITALIKTIHNASKALDQEDDGAEK